MISEGQSDAKNGVYFAEKLAVISLPRQVSRHI